MPRLKGSKNKPRLGEYTEQVWEEKWQAQKEKLQEPVPTVEKAPSKGRKKVTPTTIDSPPVTGATLFGQSGAESASAKVVKGYVNIQRTPRGGFYTGGDIHEVVEDAKKYATKNTVATIYLAFEV